MFLAEAACLVLAFILYISGVQGQESSICALKGSSVNLTCSAERPTSDMKWFTGYWELSRIESSADGSHGKYSISEENNFTLTINNLTDSDKGYYCCGKTTERSDNCKKSRIALSVADLQVKVIPSTEGQTVTLMCSISCPLTENPAVYIWYKNGEFVYEDWSPWYQELVSSEEAVRYSCAVKGYEDLRAPQVSVDSVTATCFSVTYAKGRMCSYKQTSLNEPCSITYPRGIRVQMSPADAADHLRLTCSTSCPLTAPLTSFRWYKNREIQRGYVDQQIVVTSTDAANAGFSCVIKGFEDLRSADVCTTEDNNCWSLNCFNRRICALEGSSVTISNELSHPGTKSTLWFRTNINGKLEYLHGRYMEYDDMKKQNILRLKNLKRSDSAEYLVLIWTTNNEAKHCGSPGVTLMVT
ncbi:uncharacterized protein LOC103375477, partial [Stegastes partitus]|uniref:Uncharacterized protein LOC103375477 n=1 Tax=Stegastes partitus TaxID=144197 RepID=A0A9Y4U3X5_9TELE